MAIEKIAVIGAGTMGHGIAQVAAQAGFEVALEDVSEELVARALARIEDNLKKGVERGKVSEADGRGALARLRATTDVRDATSSADLIIEAVIEKLDAKQKLFSELDQFSKPE